MLSSAHAHTESSTLCISLMSSCTNESIAILGVLTYTYVGFKVVFKIVKTININVKKDRRTDRPLRAPVGRFC